MNLYSVYKTDSNLEQNGVWLNLSDVGSSFLLARMGETNMSYVKRLTALTKPHRFSIERNTISDDVVRKILTQAFVDTVLLDWKDVPSKNGEELSYSKENALMLMEELPDLRSALMNFAKDINNYLQTQREEDAKN